MKAARFYGPGDIRIDDVPEPATRPGTVKVEVEWCGICGTDLHEYVDGPIFAPTPEAPHPLTGESMPITLGHEFAGVVAEVGQGVSRVGIGDRVVVEPYIICGRCDACRSGRYNVCRTLGSSGSPGSGGGFSQYVVADGARRGHPGRWHGRQRRDLGARGVGGHERPCLPRGEHPRQPRLRRRPSSDHRDGGRWKVNPFQFITGRIALDDIVAKGFDELITNKEENVKILVHP